MTGYEGIGEGGVDDDAQEPNLCNWLEGQAFYREREHWKECTSLNR